MHSSDKTGKRLRGVFMRWVIVAMLMMAAVGCAGKNNVASSNLSKPAELINKDNYTDFIPVPPAYHVKSLIDGKLTDKEWHKKSVEDICKALPNHNSFVVVEKIDQDGTISYGPAAVTGGVGNYIIYMDYIKYQIEDVSDDKGDILGKARIGVGLRLKANIATFEAGINVSGLMGLGIAAKSNKLAGSLSVDVIGIDSKEVGLLVPMPAELSQESIQAAMQAMASIKAKIYGDKTTLRPHVLALRKESKDLKIDQLMKNIKATP
jgi:hypothetical protein